MQAKIKIILYGLQQRLEHKAKQITYSASELLRLVSNLKIHIFFPIGSKRIGDIFTTGLEQG